MRRLMHVLALGTVVFIAAACKDQPARDDIAAMKAALNPWLQAHHTWDMKVRNAICQLETDVYDVQDSGGDTRTAGPSTNPGTNRLCPDGPGDPNAGLPPQPPVLE